MTLTVHDDLEQGSDAWLRARCGIVTASVVGQLITASTLKPANNETARGLTRKMAAERLTGHVEDTFTSADMECGILAEPYARDIYAEHHAPVEETGFMVRTYVEGVRIGYSPDGLVGDDGLIEIKSPRAKKHLHTIIENAVPAEHMAQLQCGLLVSGREWIDFVSYYGGMPLWTKRVYQDPAWHQAIRDALSAFEANAAQMIGAYYAAVDGLPTTERIDYLAGDIVI
ncbi:lambda exonuclease family protein [Nesterenkonia populi]|uniref:lambda exonuclease family protein n=1 Tax=Nesterenkonia populi TaxID=1591087 RepID=UPI0011BDD613|nr:lambda exonuclease family protein [Nesterenkonia populi]